MHTIFGPIQSRRFGTSLGVDLSPALKQCNFDCLYCELAPAATVTTQTHVVPLEEIVAELSTALMEHPNIDIITLTANGEPTLYPELDTLIDRINALKGTTQTLILTNSATLTDSQTFTTLLKLDQVKLSFDAITPEVFQKIDRPHRNINIHTITEEVKHFAKVYQGTLYLEILFVHGLNDTPEEITALNDMFKEVPCARIDLGTIDRPPAYPVQGISYGELHTIAMMFDPSLPIHIASRQHAEACHSSYTEKEILNTLDKRPLTPEDVALLFDEDSQARLQQLLHQKQVLKKETGGVSFYVLATNLVKKRKK